MSDEMSMDVTTTLTFFDKWFASHQRTCGVTRLDVKAERGELLDEEPDVDDQRGLKRSAATRLVLTCPMCGNTVGGSIRDVDMSDVVAFLSESKQN